MSSDAPVLKLSELSAIVAEVFQQHFAAERFWVTAEIIGLKMSRGHCYLQLAEKDENGTTPKAEFRGNIWSFQYERISQRFFRMTGSPLREQIEVLLCVEVKYHERYGLSLVVHDMDPAYTLGRLEMEKRQTLERLKKEGLYERNKSLELPVSMQRIALISAEDSRGFEDFMNRLETNPYGYTFEVTLYNSLLQGNLAAADIVVQLNRIKTDLPVKGYTAVALVRGGGGVSGMECFNQYLLAEQIAKFPLPVITGIGHHADRSVADEVAHTQRMTPTDVANFLIEHQAAFEGRMESYWEQVREMALEVLRSDKEQMAVSSQRLGNTVRLELNREGRKLDQSAFLLKHLLQGTLIREQHTLDELRRQLQKEVRLMQQLEQAGMDECKSRLRHALSTFFEQCADRLNKAEAMNRLLDPAEVLRRGYSYTLHAGKALVAAEEVKDGDTLTTVLYRGEIQSTVNKK
ncbi:MAG: exodeoxyribonuclease VII large subunit [Bacteroidia bacterium]|nr:exodeoxyribonuclease VII large subunit [Bacteroidia bacterium]